MWTDLIGIGLIAAAFRIHVHIFGLLGELRRRKKEYHP